MIVEAPGAASAPIAEPFPTPPSPPPAFSPLSFLPLSFFRAPVCVRAPLSGPRRV